MANANETQREHEPPARSSTVPATGRTRDGAEGVEMERSASSEDSRPHTPSATTPRCSALNRYGQPCAARPVVVVDGRRYCAMHGGRSNAKLMGAKGGSSGETAIRKATRADDELRGQAREVLAKALRGEEVDREQLAAARSLFSYRADAPPATEPARDQRQTGWTFSLIDLFRVTCERHILCQFGRAEDEAELRAIEARVVDLLRLD